jgi:RHS repeat-associated protein
MNVHESPAAATSSLAPDFRDGTNTLDDYEYDENGNLLLDRNKGINSNITYSYLDKPTHIDITNKGTIDYLYDAAGTLLRKSVYDQASGNTIVTEYDGPFVYEDNKLKFILHEEGRCRPMATASNGTAVFEYDYFVKDHLQNVRTVVNSQPSGLGPILSYNTGLEIAQARTEALVWDHLDDVRTTNPSPTFNDIQAAELLGGDPNKRIGTAIMLRAMPGDRFTLSGDSYFDAQGAPNANTAEQLVGSLFGALSGGTLINQIPVAEMPQNMMVLQNTIGRPDFAPAYNNLLTQNTNISDPVSHLNYLFFDEQFNLVPASSGLIQCASTANQWNTVGPGSAITIDQPGYILVFTESQMASSVFWNNINITYYQGTSLEENHYYPFGLTYTPIKASGDKHNKYLLTTKELQEELDLNWYDFGARGYDMQVGRWLQHDPLSEKFALESPYCYTHNNPPNLLDPNGKSPVPDDYVFDENGKFLRIDEKNLPDVLVVENSKTCDREYFSFADPVNDTRAIRDGTINKVVFVDQAQTANMLGRAGAFDVANNLNPEYINKESKGGQKLDFSYSSIPREFRLQGASSDPLNRPSPMLFIAEGDTYAHNHMNFGNFLWAAAGYTMGWGEWALRVAAHYNSLTNPSTNGYDRQLDSDDDQLSISRGVNYSIINLFRERSWTPTSGLSKVKTGR